MSTWHACNAQVDMYSLGVVVFELWHPFTTGAEREATLTALRDRCAGVWVHEP